MTTLPLTLNYGIMAVPAVLVRRAYPPVWKRHPSPPGTKDLAPAVSRTMYTAYRVTDSSNNGV